MLVEVARATALVTNGGSGLVPGAVIKRSRRPVGDRCGRDGELAGGVGRDELCVEGRAGAGGLAEFRDEQEIAAGGGAIEPVESECVRSGER